MTARRSSLHTALGNALGGGRPCAWGRALDGLAWAILPLLFADAGLSVGAIGVLAALYPAVWCVGQSFTGAWSDRVGREPLIVAGMLLRGAALALMATSHGWPLGARGGAESVPRSYTQRWRATAVDVYRLWRDSGYVVSALLGGVVADVLGLRAAVRVVAILSIASGLVVAARNGRSLPCQALTALAGQAAKPPHSA